MTPGHSNRVFSVKFHPIDDNLILSAGARTLLRCHDARTHARPQPSSSRSALPSSCAVALHTPRGAAHTQGTVLACECFTHRAYFAARVVRLGQHGPDLGPACGGFGPEHLRAAHLR